MGVPKGTPQNNFEGDQHPGSLFSYFPGSSIEDRHYTVLHEHGIAMRSHALNFGAIGYETERRVKSLSPSAGTPNLVSGI